MIGIYGIFRKSDDKCMYVGQSTDIDGRIKKHLSGKSNTPFNSDEYYGEMVEQHFINDKKYRLEREAYWINELNAELNIIKDGSNGRIGKHLTEETKEKIRQSNLGRHHTEETKEKMKGRHHTEETKEKIRQYNLGKHHTEETKKKQKQATLGRHWINNGVTNKHVKPDELHQYLENGWKLGRIK